VSFQYKVSSFEVITMVKIEIEVFSVVMLSSVVVGYQYQISLHTVE